MLEYLTDYKSLSFTLITLILTFFTFGHAVINKRDPRAALGWSGIILFSPILGVLLYFFFGINRITRKAKQIIHKNINLEEQNLFAVDYKSDKELLFGHSKPQIVLGSNITKNPLVKGNSIEILQNGEKTYNEMFYAIDEAKHSIGIQTYIFKNDSIGELFAQKLDFAKKRGVEVRVIVDDIGSKYSYPPIFPRLKKSKIPYAKFLPSFIPWHLKNMNLRNHRKIMVVDGRVAFIGGMNITEKNILDPKNKIHTEDSILDVHFKVKGAIVNHLVNIFAVDWSFCKNKKLPQQFWNNDLELEGEHLCRAISDGPDKDFEKMKLIIIGAINNARKNINILNPYFLPDAIIINTLESALLREIKVNIIVPISNNVFTFRWAQNQTLIRLAEKGANIYLSGPPFDHSKLFTVDNKWSLIGSTNLDARSLRLNFEANLEVYSKEFAQKLNEIILKKINNAQEFDYKALKKQKYVYKFRDGVAKLFTPYL